MSIKEQPEIPAVCDRCLGPNPYIEMIRDYNGAECRLCTRPFTVFEWSPQKGEKRKRTIICLTCARSKNCCQVCILDLTYGLDLQLRDSVLKMAGEDLDEDGHDTTPANALTKAYRADQLDVMYSKGLIQNDADVDENRSEKARALLLKVAASQQQQQQKVHSKETKAKEQQPLSKAELQKLISKLPFNGSLKPKTTEKDIKSFFIFGITEELPDYLISKYFEQHFNTQVLSMSIIHNAKAGYLIFKSFDAASKVASALLQEFLAEKQKSSTGSPVTPEDYNRPVPVVIEHVPLRVCWGKPKSLGTSNAEHYKIAAVVKKQMKVLADRDSKEFGKAVQI